MEERDKGKRMVEGSGGKGRRQAWLKETKERGGGKGRRKGMKEGREDKQRNGRRNG